MHGLGSYSSSSKDWPKQLVNKQEEDEVDIHSNIKKTKQTKILGANVIVKIKATFDFFLKPEPFYSAKSSCDVTGSKYIT